MVDTSPYGDPLLLHVANRLIDIFQVVKPAVTKCGDAYTCMVEGNLLVWDPETDGFNLMYPLPTSDGQVELLTWHEVIQNRNDLRLARLAADQVFRDSATFTRQPLQYGHFAEDLFLKICVQLGFRFVHKYERGDSYIIRRGSPREDMVEKIDFLLVFELDQVVPLQFTTEHRTDIHPDKQARIDKREVAYLACDQFATSLSRSRQLIRAAAGLTGNSYALWLFGEMIKVSCQRYLGQDLSIPGQPAFEDEFITQEYITKFRKYWNSRVRSRISAVERETVGDPQARFEGFQKVLRQVYLTGESLYGYQSRKRKKAATN